MGERSEYVWKASKNVFTILDNFLKNDTWHSRHLTHKTKVLKKDFKSCSNTFHLPLKFENDSHP